MAKAAFKNSTSWVSLARAFELAIEAYGSPGLAKPLLWEALAANKIWWRGLERGRKRDVDPRMGDPEFWKGGPGVRFQGRLEEGWVRRITRVPGRRVVRPGERVARSAPLSDYMFYAIEVVREHVIATLPAAAQARLAGTTAPATAAAETWINSMAWTTTAARQMKTTGEIPEGKTAFAKELEKRMAKAAKSGQPVKPVGWKHIMNQLGTWKLWPADLIEPS